MSFRLRYSHWLAIATLAVFSILLLCLVIGIRIDGDPYRSLLGQWLSQSLGRTVHLNGPVALKVSFHPELEASDIRIEQPTGFGHQDFAKLGKLQFRLDLLPLWHGQLRADRLSASDVKILLIQTSDERANWIFNPTTLPTPTESQQNNSATDIAAHFDIRKIQIERLQITYQGAGARPAQFLLDKLDAQLPADSQLLVNATGSVNKNLPYAMHIRGGSLQQLTEGKEAWPLEWQLNFAGSTFNAYGTLSPTESRLRFGLGASDLASFGKLMDIDLPNAGAAGVSGLLTLKSGAIHLNELSAQLGLSSMTGALAIDTRSDRPRLTGKLDVSKLDLRPFLGQDTEEDPPTDLPGLYRSLSQAKLNLQALNNQDVDLKLEVDQWISLPGDIRDTSLAVKLEQGKFTMPLNARVEGVLFKADLKADISANTPSFQLAIVSKQANAGGLARLLTGISGIEGQSGHLRITLDSQGRDGASLMKGLAVQLDLQDSQLSYGNLEGGKPVAFRIQRLNIRLPAGQALEGSFNGTLLGKSLEVKVAGSDLRSAMQAGMTDFTLTAAARGFAAHIASVFNATKGEVSLSFSLGAEHAGDVAVWLGLRNEARAALALAGRVTASKDQWKLSDLVLQAGKSSMHADLERRQLKGKPFYSAAIDVAQLDAVELDTLIATSKSAKPGSSTFDIPVLPRQLILDDADIRVRIENITTSSVAVTHVGFDAQVRNGFMPISPFFAELGNQRFDGAVMLDTRSSEPHAQLWLFTKNLDAGRIARDLKLSQGLDFTADSFSLYLDSHSSQLANFIANAQLVGEVSGGKLKWLDQNQKTLVNIQLSQGSLNASSAQPLTLTLKGDVQDTPVALTIRSATAKELLNPRARVPFSFVVSAANSQLALKGTLNRNLEERDLELQLSASGNRLDSMNHLLHLSMPPWGPWSAEGNFRLSANTYKLDGLNLMMGSSSLQGQGILDTTVKPPKLAVNLSAPQIQLDDFPLKDWSATQVKSISSKTTEKNEETLRKKASDSSDQLQTVLSAKTLRSINAQLSVRVDRVIAGQDQLGNGKMQAILADGRAVIGPVSIAMPGGSADLLLAYEPRENDVLTELKIDVEKFDYGVVARRFKPEADLEGRFNLHVDVHSQSQRLSDVIKHGSGNLDFLVWPKEMKADMVDLWAVNLLVALLPTIDPKNQSKVNCAIGRFTLADGKLTQRQFVIDTTKVRVTGNTNIDLAKETLHMRLQPQAKTAQFLSLATPLEVKGSFDKFSIGPNPGDVLETIVRFATSVVWVPIKRLFAEKVPEDGADICPAM
jgi:AsmA family protein